MSGDLELEATEANMTKLNAIFAFGATAYSMAYFRVLLKTFAIVKMFVIRSLRLLHYEVWLVKNIFFCSKMTPFL